MKQNRRKIQMRTHKFTQLMYTSIYIFYSPTVKFHLTVQMVYNANGLYLHKAQLSKEFNSSAVSNKGILACPGYCFEEFPDATDMHPFTDRANSLEIGIIYSPYGRLAIDLFTCKKFLLPNTKVRIKLIPASSNFFLLSDNPNVRTKLLIFRCLLEEF